MGISFRKIQWIVAGDRFGVSWRAGGWNMVSSG